MSPERVQSDTYTSSSDIWSLGISFLEMVSGKFPFGELNNIFNALSVIVKGPAPLITREQGYTNYFCEFINGMLEKDPTKRKTAKELLECTFIKMYMKKEAEIKKHFLNWIQREYQEK